MCIRDSNKYPVILKDITFDPKDAGLKPKKIIFERPYTLSWWRQFFIYYWGELILVLMVALLAGAIVLRNFIKKSKAKKKNEAQQRHWINKIKIANSRREIEEIYVMKEKWKPLANASVSNDFFNHLNKIQYAPQWSDKEYSELLAKLEALKASLP